MLAEGKTFLLRSAIFVGLASVVTTIIYFTPVPDIDFASCERPCNELDWPMICRVKLTVEVYQTLSRACGDCPQNTSDCYRRQCITADGSQQGLLTVNRQFPGPTINVCENDILLVDVVNRAPGHEMAIHWRGQSQKETPVMDGTPMVTQCPIGGYTTFQYKFRASKAGTHLWHALTGSKASETLLGALVVRQAETREPHQHLYDEDNHVVVISEWTHGVTFHSLLDPDPGPDDPATLLVNGRGWPQKSRDAVAPVPLSAFVVMPQKRHRFRVAHAGGGSDCPVRLSVDAHSLKIIALDGAPIEPREVTALVLASGERVDFVLHADQRNASYWLRVATVDGCGGAAARGLAVVRYEDAVDDLPTVEPETNLVDSEDVVEEVELLSAYSKRCDEGKPTQAICATHVEALHPLPPELAKATVDRVIYLPFGFKQVPSESITTPSLAAGLASHVTVPHVDNITFMLSPSPLLTQSGDLESGLVCNKDYLPARCRDVASEGFCQCVHVIDVELGATVELILVNQGGGGVPANVIHLHGYSFHLLGVTQLEQPLSLGEIQALDRRGALLTRNLVNPVAKDTVLVPANGVAVLRFKADNPGYWMLHDQRSSHWTSGLAAILHVGRYSDVPSPPSDFPKCGSWVGPQFFLI